MRRIQVGLALALVMVLVYGATAQEKKQKGKGKAPSLHPFSSAIMKFERAHNALMKLELNDEQKEQLDKLHEKMNPQLATVTKKVKEIVGEEKMKAAEEAAEKAKAAGKNPRQVHAAIEKACPLTDEQSKKLEAVAKEMNKIHRGMMKQVNGMLDDKQTEAFKKAMTANRGKKKK